MEYLRLFFRKYKVTTVAVVISLSSFLSLSFVDNYFETSKNLDIFATLFRELNIYYVDETDPGKLIKDGIDAMLESLDPYTNFIPETEIEDYRFMTTGQYGGIGALIRQRGDYVIISEPYEDFPAQKNDLRAGDIILEIDGKSAKGKNRDEISKILKGQPNTSVKILVKREGYDKPLEKHIIREEIKINNVSYYGMLNQNIGYIKLTSFTENAGKEVKDALVELKSKHDLKYLIFDLRGNPGGLLNEAVNVANIFIEKGQEVVSTKGKVKEWDKSYKALNTPVDTEVPVVVLVNRGSASASEIVAGTIQDLDRGIVIGQQTFGKGLVQTTRPLSYNAQLKVTTAKYYTPSGRCIQALDYSHRNEDGSVGKIPDSLISPFKTKVGRTVYDGGGIVPDISVESHSYSNISSSLLTKFLIFDYATLYKLKHSEVPPAINFNLSEEDIKDFMQYISDKDYDYATKSEKSLEEFKKDSEKEKYYDNIKSEIELLRNKILENKKEDVKKNKEEIKHLLEEEIISRYYYQDGRIEATFNDDLEIKKAIEVFNDQTIYASILNGSYTEKESIHK